jgi:glycosyltransferase involved in cell wall biosynthesis
MRIGAIMYPNPASTYRVVEPLQALARRGHEIVAPDHAEGYGDPARLATCDAVHVYRRGYDDHTAAVVAHLARAGVAIVWDNDDDFSATPKESALYKTHGALHGQRTTSRVLRVARLARVVTTPSEQLAERFRGAGINRVEVIPNCPLRNAPRPRLGHNGIVVGWIAGGEHMADTARIPIAAALRRLMDARPDVRVECIGVDLQLGVEGYRHDAAVAFEELPRRMGGFDIGIAPLADIPFNVVRSDIKVKEYAASGVPWLASPVGPYAGLGEKEGGRLVPDDGWFEALDRLVTRARERRRLGKKGAKWAKGQRIDAFADRWEAVFLEAAGLR